MIADVGTDGDGLNETDIGGDLDDGDPKAGYDDETTELDKLEPPAEPRDDDDKPSA
jgi:hypothetical protein